MDLNLIIEFSFDLFRHLEECPGTREQGGSAKSDQFCKKEAGNAICAVYTRFPETRYRYYKERLF